MSSKFKLHLMNVLIILSISVVLTIVMLRVTSHVKQTWLEERFRYIVQMSDTRCKEGANDLQQFCEYFSGLDMYYNVFAAVYDKDFELLSKRHGDITIDRHVRFDPFSHSMLNDALKNEDIGVTTVFLEIFDDDLKHVTYRTPVWHKRVAIADSYVYVIIALPFI